MGVLPWTSRLQSVETERQGDACLDCGCIGPREGEIPDSDFDLGSAAEVVQGAGTGEAPGVSTVVWGEPGAVVLPAIEAGILEPGGWRQTISSLSNSDFRFVTLSMILMTCGYGMQMVAVGYLTYDLTSSPLKLGIVESGFAPGLLLLSLFGGAIADRWDRKRIIMIGQLVGAAGSLLIAIVVAIGGIGWGHLLMLSVFDGIWFAFVWPARQAMIPQIVGRESVTNAYALNGAAMSGSFLIAPAVAGWMYGLLGPEGVFFTNAALGVLAGLAISPLPRLSILPSESKTSTLKDISRGLAYIWRTRLLLILLLIAAAMTLFVMPLHPLLPILIVDIYLRGPESMGFMLSMGGAGSLIGACFIASFAAGRRGRLLLLMICASGAGLMLIALVPLYFAAVGFMVLIGFGESGNFSLHQAIVMDQVDENFRGRVMGVLTLNMALIPLGVLPASLIAQYFGGQVAVGILATLVLATALIIFATQRRVWEIR